MLFGERLPEVAKTAGKHFVEFKRSIQAVRAEFEAAANEVISPVNEAMREEPVSREEATAPKFEPPPAEPAAREGPTAPKFEPPPAEAVVKTAEG